MILSVIGVLSLILGAVTTIGKAIWYFPLFLVMWFVGLFLLAWLFVIVASATESMKKEREKENKFLRRIMYPYIELMIAMVRVRITVTGKEKLPGQGRFLLVCNHQNMTDPGILLNAFPKAELTFVSKEENKKLPLINKFMQAIRCQFIDRNNDRQALRGILNCIKMLKADEVSVGVFPEGYTSKDGKVHPFRNGVFKIAQKAKVPIVVCTINGTGDFFHNIAHFRKTKVELHLVTVLSEEEVASMSTAQIGQKVYETMIADLGESYRCDGMAQ